MAKSRVSEPDPPVESEEESKEEEEASSEEENEGSESESEPDPEPSKTQTSQIAKKPSSAPVLKKPEALPSKPQHPASSSDEDESGSETDSDAPAKDPDPNVKPIATKPMDDGQKFNTTKKPRSKLSSPGPSSPAKPTPSAGAKRAAAVGVDGESKEVKRSKRKLIAQVENSEKKGNSNNDSKKLFQRLWSEDDEIVILKGMIDYYSKTKSDPVTDLNAFHEFIKKSLHVDVNRTQLQDKIRRLKKKYENNANREKEGKERVFAKPHEQNAYAISKKIWGNEKYGGDKSVGSLKVNGTVVKGRKGGENSRGTMPEIEAKFDREEEINELENLEDKESLDTLLTCSGGLGFKDWIAKNGMEFLSEEQREVMKKKRKELMVEMAEVHKMNLEFELELTKLVLGGLRT